MGAPRLFNNTNQMRSSIRQLAVKTREIRNNARLQNSTSRLVIRMDEDKGHSYWVESAPGSVLLLSREQEQELEKLTSAQREDEAKKEAFSPDTRVVKNPIRLPRGLFFENVEYGTRGAGSGGGGGSEGGDPGDERTIGGGVTYIHFFPAGLSEEAMIHLTNRKGLNWSIYIDALTGRAEIFERKLTLRELRKL